MGKCALCDGNTSGGGNHDVCDQEFERRDNAGLCVICGEKNKAGSMRCDTCDGPYTFKGYPPGG